MDEDKYYTPELEEFCKGFEYELVPPIGLMIHDFSNDPSKIQTQWATEFGRYTYLEDDGVIGLGGAIATIAAGIEDKKCRVKYLDGDDIMSFGFSIANDEANTYKSNKKLLGVSSGDDKTLFVQHDCFRIHSGKMRISTWIWWRENRGTEITVFEGSIKNKMEFKKLLKQIHADGITIQQ